MKKLMFISVFVIFLFCSCSGSGSQDETDADVIVIKEKMFAEQVNYIYLNAEKYLGKVIKLEGFIDIFEKDNGESAYYVIRYGPGGCCGNDGAVGFEIKADTYPAYDDWVEVKGTLCCYEEGIYSILYIDTEYVEILPERGEEYV